MAKVIVLAIKGKLSGVFTQKKLVWEILQKLEGTETLDEILIMVDKREAARVDVVALTYAKMCGQLKEIGRADIREASDELSTIKYAIWQVDINELIKGSDEEEDEDGD